MISIRIMTYNINACVGSDGKCDLDRIATESHTVMPSEAVRPGVEPGEPAALGRDGEEELVLDAHCEIARQIPALLTVIVPRHPERGVEAPRPLRERAGHGGPRDLAEPEDERHEAERGCRVRRAGQVRRDRGHDRRDAPGGDAEARDRDRERRSGGARREQSVGDRLNREDDRQTPDYRRQPAQTVRTSTR